MKMHRYSFLIALLILAGTASAQVLVKGNIYGGGNLGEVSDNTYVTINDGTVGAVSYGTEGNSSIYTTLTVNGGKVFGGGKGSTTNVDAGWVKGNTYVTLKGGHVQYNIYGGGEMGCVGLRTAVMDGENVVDYLPAKNTSGDDTGCTYVTLNGGQVGPEPRTDEGYNIPAAVNGSNGHVYGGGQGLGDDPDNNCKYFADVNYTNITINLTGSSTTNRIWGSVLGGAEDGHVLGNTYVKLQKGLIGTDGKSGSDGNIFGGGRNYQKKNYSAGRVGGNTTIEMTGGQVYGCIYGGGRFGVTGVDGSGMKMRDKDANSAYGSNTYGKATVMVKGGIVGNNTLTGNPEDENETVIEVYTDPMGSVYGGGKGDEHGVVGHPATSALLIGMVKNTEVQISEEDQEHNPTHVYGIVYGGGEVANVGKYQWDTNTTTGEISNIQISEGLAKLTISGGIIGGDKAKMRYEPGEGEYAIYPKYNDDLGYVYGGGKGLSEDPSKYDEVQEGTTEDTKTSLINLLATVNNTQVTISGGWVKGSVFGGAEAGHVRNNTLVTISGGQIGAGDGGSTDLQPYANAAFVDPATTTVTVDNALKGTTHWDFGQTVGGKTVYIPYDPVLMSDGTTKPSDGKSWFGNVFGGGSGWFPYITGNGTTELYETHWNPLCGKVWGDTHVVIEGNAHVLNNVYGGNEATDVGGKSLVEIKGGTVGVPRTDAQIQEQPCSGYVFGGGCGDPREVFNDINNINETDVQVTGGIIYGSVYGGAEDGHVLTDTKVTVNITNGIIGTSGTSKYDGCVFGGGRGLLGENVTAGLVTNDVTLGLTKGTLKSSVYGGGEMASVNGNVTVNISGGTTNYVYGGSMGRIKTIGDNPSNNDYNPLWPKLAKVKKAKVNVTGGTINNVVYGGGEIGTVIDSSIVIVNGAEVTLNKVYGGGYGSNDLTAHVNDSSNVLAPAIAGRVYGNSLVKLKNGSIVTNLYGGGELASVGYVKSDGTLVKGKSEVIVSGGTVGSAYTSSNTNQNGHVYGATEGIANVNYKSYCNVNYSAVTVSGGKIYGSVFGGSPDGHVLGDGTVVINNGADIGTKGLTFYDGHVFGGGKGNNTSFSAGRVAGHTHVQMNGGRIQGNIYGGGFVARTGVGVNGDFEAFETEVTVGTGTVHEYDSTNHGLALVEVLGGIIGNHDNNGADLLKSDQKIGNVYGAGCGDPNDHREDDFGRVANSKVKINNSPTIYGSVYGGGRMANVGHWNDYDTWYSKNTSTSYVEIKGSPTIGTALEFDYANYNSDFKTLYDTINNVRMISHTVTGNVYGCGQGSLQLVASGTWAGHPEGLEHGHSGTAVVDISGSPTIMSSVYGGSEQGAVWGNTGVTVAGGTIGKENLVAEKLHLVGSTLVPYSPSQTTTYSFGSVYGGSYGADAYIHFNLPATTSAQVVDSINGLAGRVYGNTYVSVTGGTIFGNVFGGGDLASVGDTVMDKQGNVTLVDGKCTVNVSGTAIVGPLDHTGLNAYVYGGGKGFGHDRYSLRKKFANVNSTEVTVDLDYTDDKDDTNDGHIWGSIFGGGADCHVLGDVSTTLDGGFIGTDGLTTYDGNIFGGGRNYLNVNHTAGRVAGNVTVTMTDGILQGSIFGGGRMALTGVDEDGDPFVTGNVYDSLVNGNPAHGLVTINVSGGTIGNSNGNDLLNESDESVGDIFGSGKGDTKNYDDVLAGRVANTKITVSGSPTIYGSVYGGGEMAGVGYWHEVGGKQVFYDQSGTSEVTIGLTSTDNPVIGTDYEYSYTYLTQTPAPDWTVTEMVDGKKKLIHTCTGNVFGGSQGDVNPDKSPHWVSMGRSRKAKVTITSGTIKSCVYGGAEQGSIATNTQVIINGGTIGSVVTLPDKSTYLFGGVYGGGYGSHREDYNTNTASNDSTLVLGQDPSRPNYLAGRVYGNTYVDILGGTVRGDVFGGSNYAYIGGYGKGNTTVNIGNATLSSYTLHGNVYGANNHNGTVFGDVVVNVNSGTLGAGDASATTVTRQSDVFGGGLGESTATKGDVTVTVQKLGTTAPTVYGDIYGGSALGSVNDANTDKTTVNILDGTLASQRSSHTSPNGNTYYTYAGGNVFGGGLGVAGDANKGKVNGKVTVNIGSGEFFNTDPWYKDLAGNATIKGNVYGGNNTGGSPQDDVTVNVYKTAHTTTNAATYIENDATYAIANVFGGGNESDYAPTSNTKKAQVNIISCDNTIERVFGGGNAAASTNVSTNIQGGRIDQVFGGGNGERGEDYGANISGDVTLAIHGGNIHMFVAGSNEYGTITGNSSVTVDNNGPCESIDIDEFFCGGNYVDVIGDVVATIDCNTSLHVRNLYGGCNLADIKKKGDGSGGNVNLTVNGGVFENVYGGSKGDLAVLNHGEVTGHTDHLVKIEGNVNLLIQGGTIDTVFGGCNINGNVLGSITVTIDSTRTDCPLVVHNVYGGGRNAYYSPTNASGNSPEVNIVKGTVSKKEITTTKGTVLTGGNVFGGGFGSLTYGGGYTADGAKVTSNPKVTIGGSNTATHKATVEGNVYGGGHGANVVGNPHVILDGKSKVDVQGNVYGGGSQAEVHGNANVEVK